MRCLNGADLRGLLQQFSQRRNIEVAFETSRHDAAALVSSIEQLPHGIDDIGAVGIDDEAVRFGVMPGNMNIADAFERQRLQILVRIETKILAVDVNIVYVEMQ